MINSTQTTLDTLTELLSRLVSIPTTSDNLSANHAALEYVAGYLADRGMHVRRFPANTLRHEALVASTRPDNAKTPAVLLAAHMDVMAAPKEMFTMRKSGDKLIGRGVMDMKCAIASYLQLVDELQDSLASYDFAIMLTSDEELGGRDGVNGTRELIKIGYRPKFVILPDGGENWHLETASNGYLHYSFEAHGVTGHSSRPWDGENASHKLVSTLHEIKDLFPAPTPDNDTVNIGTIRSADGPANRIPEYAHADISIRLRHKGSLEKWRHEVSRIAKKHDVHVSERAAFDVIFNDLENPYVRKFANITHEVTGVKTNGFHSFGGADARYFAEMSIPYANAYPRGGGHHSENEWLSIEALGQFYEIVRQYIERATKNPL